MAGIEVDERKFGKTPRMDSEGNIYAKGVLPTGGVVSAKSVGRTVALTTASPSPAFPPDTGSGTVYTVQDEGITSVLQEPVVANATGFLEFIVAQSAVQNFEISVGGNYAVNGILGLGSGGTRLILQDAKVGDRITVACTEAGANSFVVVVSAVGSWTNAL